MRQAAAAMVRVADRAVATRAMAAATTPGLVVAVPARVGAEVVEAVAAVAVVAANSAAPIDALRPLRVSR